MSKVENQQIMTAILDCNKPFKAELDSEGLTVSIPYVAGSPFNELTIQFFDEEQHMILGRDGYVIGFEKVIGIEGDSQYYDTIIHSWLDELSAR